MNPRVDYAQEKYQAKVRNTAVPAVYLILFHWEGSILLAQRQNTGYQDGRWELPAGHVDAGELPSEAMKREAEEEIGVTIRGKLTLVHTSYRPVHDKTGNRVDFVFLADSWINDPKICEPDKCAEVRWFKLEELPEDMVPHVREFINAWKSNIRFSEFNVEWLKEHGLYNP